MMTRKHLTRRRFLTATGVAASAPLFAGLPASSLSRIQDANEFLRLGWIGVGGRGTSLLRHALNSASESTLSVTAICDIDQGARERAIGMCGALKPAGIEDYRKLLERDDVDVVFIATPIHLHAEHAVAAMEAGKHCYCEKPLGRNPEDVKRVYDAVKKAGKKFQVGFQWRYHQGFLGLVETVQGGKIGKVNFVLGRRHISGYPTEGWYGDPSLSGDLIVEQAVHEMNIFGWMLDANPLRAVGCGGINALKNRPPGRKLMDHYAVTYDFPKDITVTYTHCVYTPPGFGGLYQEVYGSEGRGAILEDTVRLSVTKDGQRAAVEMPAMRDATELAIQSLARSIREDQEPLANVDAGRRATLMAILGRTAIYERRAVEWKEVAL